MTRLPLPPPVAKLYAAIAELEDTYRGRKFTLDGHLLGSVGEVLAETALNMRLLKMSASVHDAVCGDRGDVQIKITAKRSIAPGQFPEALGVYMEMVKSRTGGVNDMTLAVLHDIRAATLD